MSIWCLTQERGWILHSLCTYLSFLNTLSPFYLDVIVPAFNPAAMEELGEVHTWISTAFISGTRAVAASWVSMDFHEEIFFCYKEMPDLLGQKNEIKEKPCVWSLTGYLKETKATESPPFIVKQTLNRFIVQ